jgi:acyl carrier protein
MDSVLEELNIVFRQVVDNPNVVLQRSTTARDVEEWDSLTNMTLIVALEKHFKVRFSRSEIRGWNNVGEMCDSIFGK